jgi:DNA-binding SARP family transcriptional activator
MRTSRSYDMAHAYGMRQRAVGGDGAPARIRCEVLGQLRVLKHGHAMELGPRKQQLVLAALLCNANSPVTVDTLIEALWEDRPPRTARKNVQVYVSALRRLFGTAPVGPRISHQASGYVLSVDTAELDWLQFEQMVRDSRRLWGRERASDVARALDEALTLWRGPVLAGMRGTTAIDEAAQRIEDRVLTVFEDWAESELVAGASLDVAEQITAVVHRHPFRERLRMCQMTALSQVGRRTEALAVFDELRRSLAREFGLEPGTALVELHRSLLSDQRPLVQSAGQILRRPAAGCLLPSDIPAFTGRGEIMREVGDALVGRRERLLVISGPVGVGKTTLAVHAAHVLREHFPGGCYYVRLSREDGALRSLAEITSQLLWAVGVPAGAHDTDPPILWQRWLAGHRALVVIDDARHESAVRPLLPEAGESAVIVTARTRLAGLGWAYRLTLPVFSTAEALHLLRRIIGDRRVDSDQRAAERIIAVVGRLPLAVRIIGDKLAGLDHVPLNEFLVRMESAPSLFDELTVGDVAVRARLEAAIADLPRSTDNAFRRLGALPLGCFTLRDAAMALKVDEEAAVRTLESLLEASFIAGPDAETIAHDVVYEMPLLTHVYARELADAAHVSDPASEPAARRVPG